MPISELDIAVVVVSYRCAPLTVACLASVQMERDTQNLGIRAVVVDNASGDLPEIERAVLRNGWTSWVTLLAAPQNGGFAYGNNLGIRDLYARGRPNYVHLLNPDTQVRSRGIAALVEFMEAHPEVGVAGGSFETANGDAWPFAFRFPTLFSELDRGLQFGLVTRCLERWVVARSMTAEPQPTDWISGASMLIRPDVFEAVGTLDENYFLYFEETEFCRRARMAGFPTWYVPSSRVMHMIGQSTATEASADARKRFPAYWFDSRRRYYATTRGRGYAALADGIAIVAGLLGLLKRLILRRPGTPHFLRDLIRHSMFLRKNRSFPPLECFLPPRKPAASRSANG